MGNVVRSYRYIIQSRTNKIILFFSNYYVNIIQVVTSFVPDYILLYLFRLIILVSVVSSNYLFMFYRTSSTFTSLRYNNITSVYFTNDIYTCHIIIMSVNIITQCACPDEADEQRLAYTICNINTIVK